MLTDNQCGYPGVRYERKDMVMGQFSINLSLYGIHTLITQMSDDANVNSGRSHRVYGREFMKFS